MRTQQQINEIVRLLLAEYPLADCTLDWRKDYELLFSVRLAAQCTDERVNKITPALFARFPTLEDFARADVEEVEEYVRSCGFYKHKARDIVLACQMLLSDYGGKVPGTMEELLTLPGVGRKTANVVVSNAFGIPAIAVDTHVFRVANRIGLADAPNVEKTERQLMAHIPEADWSAAHHWLIYHGRQVCDAKKPRCDRCCVRDLCDRLHRGGGEPSR
mgnify:CR=1 FL=1